MNTLNIDVGTQTWFALRRAKELGFMTAISEAWTTDAALPEYASNGARVIWEDIRPETYDVVVEANETVVVLNKEHRNIRACVYGKTRAACENALEALRLLLPQTERKSNLLDVTFWYYSEHGPRSYDRQLEAPSWEKIKQNYPEATRRKLVDLQTIELKESSGKLLLWQGEPGTGKTFALRALAEEWADWCRIHYVLDPEKFFREGDYLLSVILGVDLPRIGSPESAAIWRLIVLEDAGEMLAKDAKLQVGQGVARLLNICDGLLGQGLRVLVLITTNEQVGTLHGAVSRPGRCLSHIVFEKFDTAAAAEWLKIKGAPTRPLKSATLADLYEILNCGQPQLKVTAGFR